MQYSFLKRRATAIIITSVNQPGVSLNKTLRLDTAGFHEMLSYAKLRTAMFVIFLTPWYALHTMLSQVMLCFAMLALLVSWLG